MAKVLESFDFFGPGCKAKRYPWDKWLDGQVWSLKRGEDFKSAVTSIVVGAHIAAVRRGVKVRTSVRGDTVILQAYKEDEKGG